jgi:rhamnosyltransferase
MVTYHPDDGLPQRLVRIVGQVGALVIVDNGSNDAELAMIRAQCAAASITLIANGANLGVARALNIGIEQAVSRGFDWALLLDQDSSIEPDLVATLLAVHAAHPQKSTVAVIGAGYRDVNRPDEESIAATGDPWLEVESVITSGSLLPLATHAALGPFRDEFFIDYVDAEYCFRARARGFRVIRTRRALMSHAIGAITQHQVLGIAKWTKWTFNHSPDRRYYIARNDTVLLREYGNYRFGIWFFKSFGRRFRLCKRIALHERQKASKIAAVAQGWWDGVRGRMGPRRPR